MKLAALLVTLCALSFSALRLWSSIDTTIRRRDDSVRLKKLIPNVASIHGISADGSRFDVDVESNGPVLLFALHDGKALSEVEYWNRVADLTAQNLPQLRPIGVCEQSVRCGAKDHPAPRFALLAYLDPYEMHTVAEADARGEALLYNSRLMLVARVPLNADPTEEARLIVEKARDSPNEGSDHKTP